MHPVLPSPRRGRAALGLAAVALVALSACARTEPQPEPAPATTAASALPSMDMAPFTVEVPSHDLERVPEASVAVLEGEDPDHHGAWLQVPGAPAWSEAMAGAVRAQIDQYRRDTDPSADPRLEIQPQLAVVAEDIAAARLLATERRGTDSVSTSHVIWYSAREDRVLETADLFTPDGWDAFRAEVRQRMANDPDVIGSRLDSAVDAPEQVENRRVWDAVVFLPDGSLMLEADQASMAPAAAGVLTVRIPRDTATAWLSDLGHVAADAASAPADLRLPDRSTPTPEEQQPEPAPEPEPETSSWTEEATGAPVPPPSAPADTAAPTPSATTPVPSSTAPSSSTPAPTRSATPSSPTSPPTSSSPSGTGSGSPTPSTPDPTPTSATPTPTSPSPSGPSTSAPATDPAPDPTESAPEPTATTASAPASPTSWTAPVRGAPDSISPPPASGPCDSACAASTVQTDSCVDRLRPVSCAFPICSATLLVSAFWSITWVFASAAWSPAASPTSSANWVRLVGLIRALELNTALVCGSYQTTAVLAPGLPVVVVATPTALDEEAMTFEVRPSSPPPAQECCRSTLPRTMSRP